MVDAAIGLQEKLGGSLRNRGKHDIRWGESTLDVGAASGATPGQRSILAVNWQVSNCCVPFDSQSGIAMFQQKLTGIVLTNVRMRSQEEQVDCCIRVSCGRKGKGGLPRSSDGDSLPCQSRILSSRAATFLLHVCSPWLLLSMLCFKPRDTLDLISSSLLLFVRWRSSIMMTTTQRA